VEKQVATLGLLRRSYGSASSAATSGWQFLSHVQVQARKVKQEKGNWYHGIITKGGEAGTEERKRIRTVNERIHEHTTNDSVG